MADQIQGLKNLCPESIIQSACPFLTPTGCTPQFCASGRMIRPLEPRVGENRPIRVIKAEAEAFLREMFAEGLIPSTKDFEQRLNKVMVEIEENGIDCMVREDTAGDGELERRKVPGRSSNGYVHTKEELEYGVRVSWRNSRKCIMRAHCWDLKFVDLRSVKTSRGMLEATIGNALAAYNGGRIVPTVFIFPPRRVDSTGPMFWSQQFLNFAGYELPTGEILGDPAQVQLTKDIISLGWQTPSPKTRWDILPLVTMAEDDKPMFATLPPALTRLVSIEHPHYPKIADLGLKWCRFPALSRLGFDIGGIQYTASPFIGWFMDAEIGVRNLADTFRYNVLPYVARAIGWNGPDYTFDDLPDHERLLWLSRAQAELNFAVYCSFLKAGVTCTSSLTASQSWTEFDDQHFREKGYRLNADPYWISPPQGSIVPLWHRGGAPNYQPKPLIARHRCDPVKVWKRRNSSFAPVGEQFDRGTTTQVLEDEVDLPHSKVHIFYCGTSGTASSLAERLRKLMTKKSSRAIGEFGTLNSFNPRKMHLEDTILFIVSTTGKGEIPSNGQQFMKRLLDPQVVPQSLRFSIFGIGDSGYHQTFNAASKSVHHIFEERKLTPLLLNCVVESDVAVESPPWTDFRAWWDRVEKALDGEVEDGSVELPKKEYIRTLYEQQYDILQAYKEATMDFDLGDHRSGGILKLSLEIPEPEYEVMGHIRLLPRNSEAMVDRVMELLGINDHQVIGTVSQQNFENPFSPGQMLTETQVHLPQVPIRQFLTNFIDLRSPFLSMDWALNLSNIKSKSAFQVLEYLSPALTHQAPSFSPEKLLLSMTPLRPRCYSIASSSINKSIPGTSLQNSAMDILVRIIPDGRFSQHCLSELGSGGRILYKLMPNNICPPLLNLKGKPLVAVACGTGIAPVRSLLQHLIHTKSELKISLFIGFKPNDSSAKLFVEMVEEASEKGLLDMAYVVPSNEAKTRVQDYFEDCREVLRRKIVEKGGYFYVCGGVEVVKGVKEKLKSVLGPETWKSVQGRILEETF